MPARSVLRDDDPLNADWTKQTWDLPARSRSDLPALREFIKASGMTIAQFKRLPVYALNVKRLRWLHDL
jgi:hypothetical protein